VTLTSNKGGVGKTTVAANLAVVLRGLRPELPVLVISLDDQDAIDRMFAQGDAAPGRDIASALRTGDLRTAIRLGRHDVHFVPTSPRVAELKRELTRKEALAELLARSGWSGLVLIDTKSDLELLTENAIFASDLALVPVTDQTSLLEAEKVFQRLESWGRPRTRARVVLSLVDLRIKYAGQEHGDVLALLLSQIRARGLPLVESFLSRSPRIEALNTNAEGRPLSIVEGAPGSLVHAQLRHLADEVLRALPEPAAALVPAPERRASVRRGYARRVLAFRESAPQLVELEARNLSRGGLAAARAEPLGAGERLHVALPCAGGRPLLLWARVLRASPLAALAFEPAAPEAGAALRALLVG
jgi:cellulose biosynthesis protein BcsQ